MMRTCICLLTAGLVTGLAGCNAMGGGGGGDGGDGMMGGGSPIAYSVRLDATQSTTDVMSDGMGDGMFTLSADRSELEFSISASDMTSMVTAAHFHLAPAGADGPIVFGLAPFMVTSMNGVMIEGTTNLADWGVADPFAELQAGNIYVNIHTMDFPPGEIRGQVLQGG